MDDITEIEKLKRKYLQELQNNPNNDIKKCLQLTFTAATSKDRETRLRTSSEFADFLMATNGVMTLFLSLVDFDTSSQKNTTHNQRFMALACMIADLPKINSSFEDYACNIIKQTKTLLIHESVPYSSLSSMIFKAFSRSKRGQHKSLEIALIRLVADSLMTTESDICIFKPHESIIAVANLLFYNCLSKQQIVTLFPFLLFTFFRLDRTPSWLKPKLKDALIEAIKNFNPHEASCLLNQSLMFKRHIFSTISVDALDEGEISVKISGNCDEGSTDSVEDLVEAIKISLENLINHLSKQFILEASFYFQETAPDLTNDSDKYISATIVEVLLNHRDEAIQELVSIDLDQSIDLLSRLLLSFVTSAKSVTLESGKVPPTKSVSSCLSILDVIAVVAVEERHKQKLKFKVVKILKELYETCKDNPNLKSSFKDSINKLIDKIKLCCSNSIMTRSYKVMQEKEMKSLIQDFNNPLIPTRVHALVKLRQILQENNEYYVNRITDIFAMVDMCLSDEDSYVFLSSINLVAEMALHRTEQILPKLLELYTDKSLPLNHRLNVGEVLVRLSRRLSKMGTHYSKLMLPAFYNFDIDEAEEFVISTLINMGEICKTLGHSLGQHMPLLLTRVKSLLESQESSISVKCACVDCLRSCLSGLDRLTVECIQEDIGDINKILKTVKSKSLDETLMLHADLALNEISRLARLLLLGYNDGRLVKNINIHL